MGAEEEVMDDYKEFLNRKRRERTASGIEPTFLPDVLKGFQRYLCEWSIRLGRSAVFADCGLGKSLVSLVVAENFVRHTNRPALILAPLAVSRQFVKEGEKFGIKCRQTQDGTIRKGINVTNYERLENFNPEDISCVVGDEIGCVKNADGKTKRRVADFMASVPYRLIGSATPAPNDHMELGNSSEVLGVMPYRNVLAQFFTNQGDDTQQWVLKGHARTRFWQWMATWARAVAHPRDLGYDDAGYDLPELSIHYELIPSGKSYGLTPYVARTLDEQREERMRTLKQRCRRVAEIIPKDRPAIIWCHYNSESSLLAKLIPDAVEVRGSDKVEVKEKRLMGFSDGSIRVLISKPKIAGFGLNWQHCSDVVYFPSHSHEQYYQAIRRCWRFGQARKVNCNIVAVDSERAVIDNMLRKERQSIELYHEVVRHMNAVLRDERIYRTMDLEVKVPSWL
jgi:hypothetical protein